MFWRENAAQHEEQQQKQPQQEQPKRLSFSFNVKIAVNVNTKMSTTHISPECSKLSTAGARSRSRSHSRSHSSCSSGYRSGSKIATKTKSNKNLGLRQQLVQLGRKMSNGSGHGGISTILIVNLLMLLLLSLCCDVCRSHAEQQQHQQFAMNFTALGQEAPPMRPMLDSDVVEKVAVWSTHVGAAPPSVIEGIAISSMARTRPQIDHKQQLPKQQQKQQQDVAADVDTDVGIDERIVLERVTRDCVQRCIVEEDLFLDEFGIKCEKADSSDKCYKTRCTKGCAQWYRALKEIEPCQEACASTQFYPFDMPCIGACEMAQRDYWHLQRLAMVQLVETTQPQFVKMSGENPVLTIKWAMQFPENYLSSRPFNIQHKQVEIEGDSQSTHDWHNLADFDCDEHYVCEILEALMPYTRYKFRFELPFGESSEDVLYSPATSIYQTPMEGAPISAPIIDTLMALDASHIAVHWRPGHFSNAPIEGYRLLLSSAGNISREQLLPAHRESYIFAQLQALSNYTISLSMINKQGEGPSLVVSIVTKALPLLEPLQSVLLANGHTIIWQSLEPAGETRVLYESQNQTTISDFAWSEREQRLWLLDDQGQLYSRLLNETKTQQLHMGEVVGDWLPTKLSLDWLQRRLYIAAISSAAGNRTFGFFSCDLEGNNVEQLQVLQPTMPTQVVRQLEIDALNGWLFWRDAESLQRLNLHTKQSQRLMQSTQLEHFVLDPQHWLLYVLQAQQLLELSYDGNHRLPQTLHGSNWQSFAMSTDQQQLLLANATQLQLLERHSLAVVMSWPLKQERNHNWRLLPLEPRRQPLALKADVPQRLTALLGAQSAKISWLPPATNPYQSSAPNCSYELEVLDVASQSAYNIRNIYIPHFGLERLQPDNLYQLRVRAINMASVAGAWTPALHSRTWPLGEHRLRWLGQDGTVYTTNELGVQLQQLQHVQLAAGAGPLVQLNDSVGYYISRGTLHCINLLQPAMQCMPLLVQPVQHVGSLAYDWRGGLLYWTDLARNCVQRLDPLTGAREMLPIFGARHLALDAAQGHLYYSSGSHLARRVLNGEQPELEYYQVNGLSGEIIGFCLDLRERQLYWLVQAHSELLVYRSALVTPSQGAMPLQLLATVPQADAMPHTLQHLAPLGALLWLSANGSHVQLLRLAHAKLAAIEHIWPVGLTTSFSAVQLLEAPPLPPDDGVVPSAVPPDSIHIDEGGHWDNFRIRWQMAVSGGNYSIGYKLLLEHGSERVLTLQLATPFARITQLAHMPQALRLSITPYTAWRSGPSSGPLQLVTPISAPTQPRRLRVFVERQAEPMQHDGPKISALLRWDVDAAEGPEHQPSLQYHISCWRGTELHSELLLNQSTLEARIEQLQPDETYRFQVQAHIAATGQAAGATSYALHVSPEVQSVPRLLYANAEHIGELDLDTGSRRQLVHTPSPVEHLTLLSGEQRLLWVNEHVELMSHVPGQAPAKIARMRAEVLALTADWVQRVVYWAELDALAQPATATIYTLNLCQFEGRIMQGVRLWSTPPGQLLRDLVVLPNATVLVWLQHQLGETYGTLQGLDAANKRLNFEDLDTSLWWRLFEGSQESGAETLNLVDNLGRLCVYHVARQLCVPNKLRAQFNFLQDGIVQLAQDPGYLYALRNGSVRAYGRRRQQLEYLVELQSDEVRLLHAYTYQPYPSRHCLILPAQAWIEVLRCEEMQCSVSLPFKSEDGECPGLSVPGLSYQLNLTTAQQEQLEQPTKEKHRHKQKEQVRQMQVYSDTEFNISALQPFQVYKLHANLTSYYQKQLGMEPLLLEPVELHTAVATPSVPRNFSGRALSPNELEVSWLAPLQLRSDSVYYTLHWQLQMEQEDDSEDHPTQEQRVESAGTQRLANLQPGRLYQLWLQAHATPTKYNSSLNQLTLRTYAPLPPLQLVELNAYGMTLAWPGTTDVLSSLMLECSSLMQHLQINIAGQHEVMNLTPLQPKTRYACRLALSYAATPDAPIYYGASQEYETLGDAPSAPGRPQLEHIAGEIFRVSWKPALENGSPIQLYNLEALQARSSSNRRRRRRRETSLAVLPWAEEPMVIEDQWLDYCNTTELSCIVRELHTSRLLMFRVRARNREHGWGPYSEDSERITEPFVSPEKRGSLVLAIIAPAAIVSSCVLALVLVRKIQKRRHRAKKLLQQSRPSIWSNLSALQTQQQLLATRSRTFSTTLSDADIALLPQISWSQLTLLQFLGSGAFGEVYEGQLQGENEAQPQRVAIKSLRKGASEFAELLQEAQLMSNFKHKNIVCLIGICFDSESISLIMEHMEAGDLLSYLRAARPSSQDALPRLQQPELLNMCMDVANGCSYMEEMHFVHRDLACRNCLVSEGSPVGGRRIVKIGDFGLARDIYKCDYYRKEGEGLLPVRWMAPESLVDGIFSTQSDVWAFGVLCWEILTLGQQPYAARNNFEVLAHVTDGGRLQMPDQCPEKLYALLLQCWRSEPWERPTFRRCCNALQTISTDLRRSQMSTFDASEIGGSGKSETRVRFDETTDRLSLENDTKDVAKNIDDKTGAAHSTTTTSCDNFQLYANEAISRL